ncbi:hypothetical protein BGZ76_006238 [Entomortierella beljakovae]|nr:hypothetical protein BGZ76_006238 [Entomortierella beljakovae]
MSDYYTADQQHSSVLHTGGVQQLQQEEEQHIPNETDVGVEEKRTSWLGGGRSPLRKSKRFKIIIGTVIVLLVALIGILAWYFSSRNNSDSSTGEGGTNDRFSGGGGGSSSRSGGGNGSKPGQNNSNGKHPTDQPTTITAPDGTVIPNLNHELKRVFYGMAYVPIGAQLPNCYNTQESIDEELMMLAQTTRRVRLYGTDCNVLRFTMDSIKRLNLDLKVVVGIWIDAGNETFSRQYNEFVSVATTFGWENILGVSVGNEVLFDKYQTKDVLLQQIKQVKDQVVAMGHPEIPVFTSDLQGANKPSLTSYEDKAGVNLHPFFSGVPVSDAASWFWKFLDLSVKPTIGPTKEAPIDIWVTEVGWPTFPAISRTNSSVPSVENLQIFIDTWLCDANAKGLPYYFFEFFDAPWKIWPGSAVEGFWGLLTIDKKLKVKLPDCLAN